MDSFDHFVSYNSRDVVLARRLTERLLGDGLGVWFNEYQVHSHQQADFQLLVNRGIDRCQGAVLVVGPGYADSPYCNIELERILRRRIPVDRIHLAVVDGLDRLLALYPELSGARRWPAEPQVKVPLGRHEWVVREAGFAFDNSTWAVEPKSLFRMASSGVFGFTDGQERSVLETFIATEGLEARLFIDYARLDGIQAGRIRERYARSDDEAEVDDRRRLNEELHYFRTEASRVFAAAIRRPDDAPDAAPPAPGSVGVWRGDVEEIGVHLFATRIAERAIKQRLFSFRQPALPAIFRVYKVSFLHPLFDDAPFVVRFVFRFPDDRRAFFRGIPWCDALVNSLRVLGESIPTGDQLVASSADFTRRMKGKR